MPNLLSPAMFLFQDAPSSSSDLHLIMIFTGILAACVLLVILGVVIGALVVASKVSKLSKQAQQKAQPLIAKGQELLGHTNQIVADLKPKIASISADLQPKIASISSDVQHISGVARAKADEVAATVSRINETVQDTTDKTRSQVSRVNGLISDALTTTQEVSRTVQEGIKLPVRQAAGIIAGVKRGLETLGERWPMIKMKPESSRAPRSAANSVDVSRTDLP